jgi:NADH:ubiquinone oxidoreductase subunit 3 (subunit A)
MKTRISSTITKLLVAVLVIVVGILAVNSTANYHLHKLPNGQIVAHAHPFTQSSQPNSPVQSHKHTSFEFYFFSSLLLLFSVALALLASASISYKRLDQPFYRFFIFENSPELLTNKAPPVLV